MATERKFVVEDMGNYRRNVEADSLTITKLGALHFRKGGKLVGVVKGSHWMRCYVEAAAESK